VRRPVRAADAASGDRVLAARLLVHARVAGRAGRSRDVNFPERVSLVEVGPRDGLQSLPETYPLDVKIQMVETLARAGLEKIEVTAFVRPDVIPQLADAEELLARVTRFDGCVYRALVPNARGAERAAAAGVDEMLG